MRVAFDLSHPYASTVSVDWRTVDVPRQAQDVASSAAGDYIAGLGPARVPREQTRQQVQITVRDDDVDEVDELGVIRCAPTCTATLGREPRVRHHR